MNAPTNNNGNGNYEGTAGQTSRISGSKRRGSWRYGRVGGRTVLSRLDSRQNSIARGRRRNRERVGNQYRGGISRRRGEHLRGVIQENGVRHRVAGAQPRPVLRGKRYVPLMFVRRRSVLMFVMGMAHRHVHVQRARGR
jgi:hypothetical protein